MLCSHLAVSGIHEEIVATSAAKMKVVGSEREKGHVEISIDPGSEGWISPIEPGAITRGDNRAPFAMTGKGFYSLRRALRGGVPR